MKVWMRPNGITTPQGEGIIYEPARVKIQAETKRKNKTKTRL